MSAPLLLLLAVLHLHPTAVRGLDNGLGRTPPLGWSSWYVAPCTQEDGSLSINRIGCARRSRAVAVAEGR